MLLCVRVRTARSMNAAGRWSISLRGDVRESASPQSGRLDGSLRHQTRRRVHAAGASMRAERHKRDASAGNRNEDGCRLGPVGEARIIDPFHRLYNAGNIRR